MWSARLCSSASCSASLPSRKLRLTTRAGLIGVTAKLRNETIKSLYVRSLSFRMMFARCASTVFTLISSAVATSLLLRPSASNVSTSSSRAVTSPGDAPWVLVFANCPMISLVTAGDRKVDFA